MGRSELTAAFRPSMGVCCAWAENRTTELGVNSPMIELGRSVQLKRTLLMLNAPVRDLNETGIECDGGRQPVPGPTLIPELAHVHAPAMEGASELPLSRPENSARDFSSKGMPAGAATRAWKKGRHSSKSSVVTVNASGSARRRCSSPVSVPRAVIVECGVGIQSRQDGESDRAPSRVCRVRRPSREECSRAHSPAPARRDQSPSSGLLPVRTTLHEGCRRPPRPDATASPGWAARPAHVAHHPTALDAAVRPNEISQGAPANPLATIPAPFLPKAKRRVQ